MFQTFVFLNLGNCDLFGNWDFEFGIYAVCNTILFIHLHRGWRRFLIVRIGEIENAKTDRENADETD